MVKPDYRGGSIVNLVSTIMKARGGPALHKPLRILSPKEIQGSKNIVLVVIDGLGYNLLIKRCKGGAMAEHLRGKMTSVFPSTTSAAVTTFKTGLEPIEHGIVSWFTYLREFGFISIPLRSLVRGGSPMSFEAYQSVYDSRNLFDLIKTKSFLVHPDVIHDSPYTRAHSGKAKRAPFKDLNGMVRAIKRAVKSSPRKKYIYAYWHGVDTISHVNGPESRKTVAEVKRVDRAFARLLKELKGTDTAVILTADHGQIQSSPKHTIIANEHPRLKECLAMPFSGDAREAFAYVRPGKEKQLVDYVKTKLKHACDIYKSEDFAKRGYFGEGKAHKRFMDRIGDYILLAKKDYKILDSLPGQALKIVPGNHSGLSDDEMWVPLVVARC